LFLIIKSMGEDHEQIMKLQTQSTALQRKMEAETQRLNEMIALSRQVEKKIHEQRSDRDRVRSGGVYASKTTTLRATLKHGQLETRRAGLNRKAAQVCHIVDLCGCCVLCAVVVVVVVVVVIQYFAMFCIRSFLFVVDLILVANFFPFLSSIVILVDDLHHPCTTLNTNRL